MRMDTSTLTAPSCAGGRRRFLCGAASLALPSLLIACGGDGAAPPTEDPPTPARTAPARLALVLSGGGLRGFAHVGVLRVLRRLDIEPDLVVGCSMGAVIGGLYAAGVQLDVAERMKLPPEMDPWGGLLISPQARSDALRTLLRAALKRHRIEEFPLRFVAVATARDSGQMQAFGAGDAVQAILASAALPGALLPVKIGEREYLDGGLSQPLPVRAARALGAHHIIAVDVSFHPMVPAPSGRIDSMFHAGMLMTRNLSIPDRAEADVLIEPVLPPVPQITLEALAQLVDCGERAAMALLPQLRDVATPS